MHGTGVGSERYEAMGKRLMTLEREEVRELVQCMGREWGHR
jgi:hypothetical protein